MDVVLEDGVLISRREETRFGTKTLGNVMYETLKNRPHDDILLTQFETGESLTCGLVLRESLKCASAFEKLRIGKDDVVTISSENDPQILVVQLAAWFVGATVNPLNPNYGAREIRHALDLCKPKLIICSTTSLDVITSTTKDSNIKIILINRKNEAPYGHNPPVLQDLIKEENVLREIHSNCDCQDVACLLMSSGTTGLPKAVMVTHENVLHCLYSIEHENFSGVKPHDVSLNILPYFHIFGLTIALSTVVSSLKQIELHRFQPETFLRAIEKYRPNKIFIVPTVANFLAKSPLVDGCDTSSLETLINGAAFLPEEIEGLLKSRLGVAVKQIYGASEIVSTTLCFQSGECHILPNTALKIRDIDTGETLGVGSLGELCFKGPFVMKGYKGDLISTGEALENGFVRSGDLGYRDAGNRVHLADRIGDVFKCKGFQIAPAEIESVLSLHPAVREVAVVGRKDDKCGAVPLAFVVKNEEVDESVLLEFVERNICKEKRLYGVKFLDSLPKTQSGKVLKTVLRDLANS